MGVMAVEATATVDAATAVATMARGLLMPTLSPATAMVVMVDAAMAVATMARGRLRLSPATAMAAMVATGADAATAVATTERGLLMPSPRLMPASSSLALLLPSLPPPTPLPWLLLPPWLSPLTPMLPPL